MHSLKFNMKTQYYYRCDQAEKYKFKTMRSKISMLIIKCFFKLIIFKTKNSQ